MGLQRQRAGQCCLGIVSSSVLFAKSFPSTSRQGRDCDHARVLSLMEMKCLERDHCGLIDGRLSTSNALMQEKRLF